MEWEGTCDLQCRSEGSFRTYFRPGPLASPTGRHVRSLTEGYLFTCAHVCSCLRFVRRVVDNSGFTGRDAAARLSGLGYVPNVQEVLVRGRSDITFGVSRSAVQGGTDVLLGVSEFGQGHPEGRTVLELVEVAQNEGNNRLMFAISRTRNFAQVHRLEVGYGSVRFQSDPPDCKRITNAAY